MKRKLRSSDSPSEEEKESFELDDLYEGLSKRSKNS
jgi:hypothetical protein